ncbi:PAS domain S-box protein [Prosthecobacter sp.]|uniref:PAS domain S-box protein n=1 Tax=Prosthecobacter sp. TaxID=1965333 RepID=UPI00378498D1
MTAPFPPNEAQRLQVLRAYDILDSPAEVAFDEITALAADICQTPIALVTLVDGSRQWFKSRVGLSTTQTPRDHAFCAHALASADLLIVPDALKDERFARNPLVLGDPQIRFYAGAPLVAPGGEALGTLCVIDRVPRQLTEMQQRALRVLSQQVMSQIQLRHEVRGLTRTQDTLLQTVAHLEQSEKALRQSETDLRSQTCLLTAAQAVGKVGSWVVNTDTFEAKWSPETHRIFGTTPETCEPSYPEFLKRVHPEDLQVVDELFQTSIKNSSNRTFVHRMIMPDGRVRHIEQRWEVVKDASGKTSHAIGTSQDVTERILAEQRLERINKLYAVSSGINEAIVRIKDTQRLYEEACRIAVERGGLLMAWVGAAQLEDQKLVPVAMHGIDDGYLDLTKISLLPDPRGQGPPGRAFRENQMVFCNDISTDERMAPWREEALKRGFRASASFPLRVGSQPVGVYTVYGGTPGYFKDEEFEFLNSIAENISFAIESHLKEQQRLKVEQAHFASEASLAAAQHIGHFGSWELDLREPSIAGPAPLRWSDEMCRIAGFAPGTAEISRERCLQHVHPEDRETVRQEMEAAVRERRRYSAMFRFIRPDGTERIVQQTAQVYLDGTTGKPVKLIGTAHDITEQRKSDEALLASEERFRSFMTHSPVAGWIVDVSGRFHYVSPGYFRMFGVQAQDLTGRSVQDIYEPELAGIYLEKNRTVIATQSAIEGVMPGKRADGSPGEFLVVKFPIVVPGKETRVGCLALDVTEQRHAEHTLRESEARFRSYFELATHGIAITTLEKGWVLANDQICDILGYPREELMAMTWPEITYPADLEVDQRQFAKLLAGTLDRYELEKRFVRKDGRVIWGSIGVGCVRNPDRSIAYFIGVLFDITERKQAEEILREQATLLDKAQDAIIVRDLKNRILYWNRSAERLYGWSAAEAIGRSGEELLYRDPTNFRAALAATLTQGEWVGEIQQWTKAGEEVVVEGRWNLIHTDEGRPKAILTINTDITERKKVEQQFLRAQRMESIGTLAGGIAHDLNNVLSPIMMSIDLLRLTETNPKRMGILSTIETSTKRGADMVRQVLSFARGVSGQRVEVKVEELIQEIEKIANETFLKSIQVRSVLPAGLWVVLGDPTQLHQVLLNLCVNARDAMPEGGTLTLSADNTMLDAQYTEMNMQGRPGPYVIISVADTGTGMPPEVVERIFEPFFTTKEVGRGTGLGLSTTMAIVKSHGGFIRVQSEKNMGTKFSIYLPALAELTTSAETTSVKNLPHGNGECILLVDDEAAVREITRQTLESFGYRVLQAGDGVEAVAVFSSRQNEIAAVLIDLMMPLMDGPTAIQILLRLKPGLRVIAASGLDTDHLVAKARNAGARQFLPKPYTAETILHALHTMLHEPPETDPITFIER